MMKEREAWAYCAFQTAQYSHCFMPIFNCIATVALLLLMNRKTRLMHLLDMAVLNGRDAAEI